MAADPIEAHKGFVISARAGDSAALANRERSQTQLSAAQVEEGERRADAWQAKIETGLAA